MEGINCTAILEQKTNLAAMDKKWDLGKDVILAVKKCW